MDAEYICSKEYHLLANDLLRDFAINVQEKMYSNFMVFGYNKHNRPPIEEENFSKLINEFQIAYVKKWNVVSDVKSIRIHLLNVLDSISLHVETIAKVDKKLIEKCGFNPVKTIELHYY